MSLNIKKDSILIENRLIDVDLSKINLLVENSPTPYLSMEIADKVSYYKGFIDKIDNYKKWDIAKKISNPYELINHSSNSVSLINPISRSYFKFLELIQDYHLIDNINNFKYIALAEGPGGFVECFIKYRKSNFLGRDDNVYCMTLSSDSNEIPNWNKARYLFQKNNIHICYGLDGTGNIYNPENLKYLRDKLGGSKAHLVSADGGFDYSIDFNQQEQMSSQLIFSEIVGALSMNCKEGHFILKIFDTFKLITLQMIYLLSLYYKQVHISKPFTSRPANSEKYLVCKYFKGIHPEEINHLYKIQNEWNKNYFSSNDNPIGICFSHFTLDKTFINYFNKINLYFAKQQIKNILTTISLIEKELEPGDIRYLKKKQVIYALSWCKKYKNPIHFKNLNKILNI